LILKDGIPGCSRLAEPEKTVPQKRKAGAISRTPSAVIYEVIMPHIKVKSKEKWNAAKKESKA
jgi:hypothetical protein